MKKIVFTLILLFIASSILTAQHHKNYEKFKAYKIAYITQELDLKPKEAEEFWPIYNAYEKKSYEYRVLKSRKIKKQIKEKGGVNTLNEKDIDQYITSLLQYEKEFISLKENFYKSLNKVLPSYKVLKLYNSENEFNRKVLSQYRKHKHKPVNN